MRNIDCSDAGRVLQLRRVELFAPLQAATLARLASRAQLQEYAAQEILQEEGAEAGHFFALVRGQVKIVHRTGTGREHLIHVVSEGATVGEACMFRQKLWPATAVAQENCLVLRIPRDDLLSCVRSDPELAEGLLGAMSLRVRMLVKKLSNQGVDASRRVSRYILHRALIEQSRTFTLKVSREEMANMLGIARETLSRVLSRLVNADILTVQGREVTVLDRARLEDLAAWESGSREGS